MSTPEILDADETQYDIEEIELPASFDSAILEAEIDARQKLKAMTNKRPRSPSPPPPDPEPGRRHDLVVPTGEYLASDTYGASRFGDLGDFMRRKRQKQRVQDVDLLATDGGSQSDIFKNISIYVNGWTDPSEPELRELVLKHGGDYQPHLDRKSLVTHIITCSLTPAKMREFKHMKVVTPPWITESVKRGTLLNWRNYVFRPGSRLENIQGRKSTQQTLPVVQKTPRNRLPSGSTSSLRKLSPKHLQPLHDHEASPNFRSPSLEPPPPNQLQLLQDRKISPPWRSLSPEPPPPNQLALQRNRHTDYISPSPEDEAHTNSYRGEQELTPPTPALPDDKTPTKTSFDRVLPIPPKPVETGSIPDPTTAKPAGGAPAYAKDKSNPYAQRVMADADWRTAHTSIAPDFIEGYYKNSRLHHLSAWKAELKALVQEAQETVENGNVLDDGDLPSGDTIKFIAMKAPGLRSPTKDKGKQKAVSDDRIIMHCDFDSFFVSVGLLERPHLVGKPVAVCHSQGTQGGASSTSEIASASYEARKFGVKGGMSLQQARKLCPGIVTIPYEFEKYKSLSLQFYTILMSYADDLQAVSVDEALIETTRRIRAAEATTNDEGSDVSGRVDHAVAVAEVIRARVKSATGCTVSIGISHNIMLARLATRKAKPDGVFHLLLPDLPGILAPLQLDDLHGFGRSAKQKATEKLGSCQLADLLKKGKAELCEAMGKGMGEALYNALRGVDERKLESDKPRKSVSCDINYGIRFDNDNQAETFISQMAEEVARRMDAINVRGSSLTLKVMKRHPNAPKEAPKFMGHGICETFNKQSPLAGPNGRPTSNAGVIAEHAVKLLRGFCFDCKELRGLAIQIQKLEPAVGAATAMAGQGRLPFPRQKDLRPASTSVNGSSHIFGVQLPAAQEPVAAVQLPPQDVAIVEMGPPSVLPRPDFDLPSFSQVDQSVFDALPEDVRKELNAEYDRRSRSRSRSITPLPPPQVPFKQPGQVASPSRTRIFVHGAPEIQRMTRQIAPKRSALKSPTKSWFTKGTGFSALDVNELELKKLDIDIDVFMSLPRELQREQLAVARQIKSGNPLPQPGPRKVIKATVFKPRRGWVNPFKPPPPPKANIPAPPTLKQSIVRPDGAREKVFITDKDDVEDIIERWVDGYNQKGPNTKDVEFFATFLIKSITANKRDGTDGGVEKAIRVLHWWQLLLRRDFASAERAPDAELFEPIGFAWWTAFGGVRSRLNDVMRQRFGGSIGLS